MAKSEQRLNLVKMFFIIPSKKQLAFYVDKIDEHINTITMIINLVDYELNFTNFIFF